MKISFGSGFLTESEAKAQAYAIAASIYDPESIGSKAFQQKVDEIASSLYLDSRKILQKVVELEEEWDANGW